MIGVGPAGETHFILEADMNIYRSFRMKSLHAPSWNGFTRCTAALFSDFSLNAPIIDIDGAFVAADMVYTGNGHYLRFQREAAGHGAKLLEAQGAWRGGRGDRRFGLGSRIMAAGLSASGRWKKNRKLWPSRVYDPTAGDLTFRLTGVDSLEDIAEYDACDAAWLTFDGAAYSLVEPSLFYGLDSFWVEMAPLLGDVGEVWFEVTDVSAP